MKIIQKLRLKVKGYIKNIFSIELFKSSIETIQENVNMTIIEGQSCTNS
jgi:hypothetical protein